MRFDLHVEAFDYHLSFNMRAGREHKREGLGAAIEGNTAGKDPLKLARPLGQRRYLGNRPWWAKGWDVEVWLTWLFLVVTGVAMIFIRALF